MTSGTGDFTGDFGGGSGFSTYKSDFPTGKGSGSDFNRLSSGIGSNIQKISKNVRDIERLTSNVGTAQDSKSVRIKLDETQHYTNQVAKDTNKMLKDLASLPIPANQSDQRQQRMQRERLTNDFSDALNQFQRVQREAAQKERESVARARASSDSANPYEDDPGSQPFPSPAEYHSGGMAQTQVQDGDLEGLMERETQLKKLESDILDVNQIFKDVATMVHEQGEMIDSIEANVESAEVHVEQANTQLTQARDYQRKSRRKKIYIFICVLLVLGVIALVLYITLK